MGSVDDADVDESDFNAKSKRRMLTVLLDRTERSNHEQKEQRRRDAEAPCSCLRRRIVSRVFRQRRERIAAPPASAPGSELAKHADVSD